MDLFETANRERPKPLAAEIRPESLDEIVGQRHLLGPGAPFRRRIDAGRIGAVILFGPPGLGKTSIARAIGVTLSKEFRQLHPAQNNVADLKKIADEAKFHEILVFVDEVHRFSATWQDYLLGMCEEGVFDFLAATTASPYHALTPALVSRATLYELQPLAVEDVEQLLIRGIRRLAQRGVSISMEPAVMRALAARAGGDGRRAITALESISLGLSGAVMVTPEMVAEAYAAAPIMHDRSGTAHYDVTSAFVKAMRGSDADSSLFWLARMIHAGEDPRYIARRIMIHASEDVGLADNTALQTAVAAAEAVEKIGYPEASIVLAHAVLHIARAPKSNSACRGINAALEYVRSQAAIEVPPHLRDGHYKGAAQRGAGAYAFPHADPRGWVDQPYAPGITPGMFYQSDARANPTFEQRADSFWEQVTGKATPRVFEAD